MLKIIMLMSMFVVGCVLDEQPDDVADEAVSTTSQEMRWTGWYCDGSRFCVWHWYSSDSNPMPSGGPYYEYCFNTPCEVGSGIEFID